MKRTLGWLVIAVGIVWAGSAAVLNVREAQAATASLTETGVALTGTTCVSLGTATTGGFDLTNVTGWRVIASAPSGQTFTSGTAICCFRSAKLGRWMACDSSHNLTLAGARDIVGLDNQTTVGAGRVRYLGSSVVLSGGSTFDVAYEVTQQ